MDRDNQLAQARFAKGSFVAYREMRSAEADYCEVALPAASLLALGAPGLVLNLSLHTFEPAFLHWDLELLPRQTKT